MPPNLHFSFPRKITTKISTNGPGSPVCQAFIVAFLLGNLGVVAHGQSQVTPDSDVTRADRGSILWQDLCSQESWVFLGDSNTYSGGYVAILDAWLSKVPQAPKVLNLGVSSETASGLSEVDHPFKRPCVHERVEKVLRMVQPPVVFICYGMNDGIYQPASTENLAAYRKGMHELAAKIKETGAKLIVLTPPIFEPEPLQAGGKLGPTEAGRYAYFAPAANYDQVLKEQTDWCLTNELQADLVIDIHTMLHREKQTQLQHDPEFAYTKDGVHFSPVAHGLVAETILTQIGAPLSLTIQYPSDQAIRQSVQKNRILRDAYLSATGKNRPGLPAGLPIWFAEKIASRDAVDAEF